MNETNFSNFTMDIIQNHQNENTKQQVTIICPVCHQRKDPLTIEEHAMNCATEKYPEFIICDNESSDEDLSPISDLITESKDLLPLINADINKIKDKLKQSLEKCEVRTDKVLQVKVRRQHTFNDFLKRFKSQWVRECIGSKLFIVYYGESGVDQGGLSREFFSGTYVFYMFS